MVNILLKYCFELLKLDNFGCADFQWMDKMTRIYIYIYIYIKYSIFICGQKCLVASLNDGE